MLAVKKYWYFYRHLLFARLGKDLERPYNFLFAMSGSLCFFLFHIISYSLIISKFHFPGWSVSQLWVLLATFEIMTYLMFFILYRGLMLTVRDLHLGTFDIIISKPLSSRFIAFFRNGSAHNFFSSILGVLFLIIVIIYFHIPISLLNIFLYLLTTIVSIWIFHCLSLMFVCLNFFYGYLPFTVSIIMQIQEIYKYPATIFGGANFFLKLIIIPLTALMSLPAAILLLKPLHYSFYLYYFGFTLLLTISSHYLWNFSLRHYSSAS